MGGGKGEKKKVRGQGMEGEKERRQRKEGKRNGRVEKRIEG